MIKNETDYGAFIPSFLDDYGLDPYEFRIYAHILRRAGGGRCWESIPNMARHCRMNEKTARRAVKRLLTLGMIASCVRQGATTEYTVTNPKQWATPTKSDPSQIRPLPNQGGGASLIREGGPTKLGRGGLPDLVDEGYPNKEIPIKEIPRRRTPPAQNLQSEVWESNPIPKQGEPTLTNRSGETPVNVPAVDGGVNPYDAQFLNGAGLRQEQRAKQRDRESVQGGAFSTVEEQDDFWRQSVARLMTEDPRLPKGKAQAIATGFCRQLNSGDPNTNPQAREYFTLWQDGRMSAIAPVTAAEIKTASVYDTWLKSRGA